MTEPKSRWIERVYVPVVREESERADDWGASLITALVRGEKSIRRSVTSGELPFIVLYIHTEPSGFRTMKAHLLSGTFTTASVLASSTTAARQESCEKDGPQPVKKTTEPNKAIERDTASRRDFGMFWFFIGVVRLVLELS